LLALGVRTRASRSERNKTPVDFDKVRSEIDWRFDGAFRYVSSAGCDEARLRRLQRSIQRTNNRLINKTLSD
jgi:hypothetical protein